MVVVEKKNGDGADEDGDEGTRMVTEQPGEDGAVMDEPRAVAPVLWLGTSPYFGEPQGRGSLALTPAPPPGAEDPRLSTTRSVKQPPQRRESFDTCPSPGPAEPFPALQESPEEKPKAQEELRGGPEPEGESGARSEPSTPKPGRAALLGAGGGRSPAATRSRAEKCGGVHISGPFSVTVPFHITSNLSRLTRGQPCPALGSTSPPPPAHRSAGEPAAPEIPTGEIFGDGTDMVTPGGGFGEPPLTLRVSSRGGEGGGGDAAVAGAARLLRLPGQPGRGAGARGRGRGRGGTAATRGQRPRGR